MKLWIYVAGIIGCCNIASAQSSDSVVQYRHAKSALTEKSGMSADNRHYQSLPVNMGMGDIALIVYESKDFITSLFVRDSTGNIINRKVDDTGNFEALGSEITLPFKAPATGIYYFIFASKNPDITGKFDIHLFYYNKRNDHINSNSSFCDKLKYISSNSYTGFEFLKKSGVARFFEPTIKLLPEATNQISQIVGDAYTSRFPSTSDLDALQKKFDELEINIKNCLADHEQKIYTLETVRNFEKEEFIRKVEFTLSGKYPKDLNGNHILEPLRDKVVLSLTKDGTDKYRLILEVE